MILKFFNEIILLASPMTIKKGTYLKMCYVAYIYLDIVFNWRENCDCV